MEKLSSFVRSFFHVSTNGVAIRRHQNARKLRKNPEALDDIPHQFFLRLVGFYKTIPMEVLNDPSNEKTVREFKTLRSFIDGQLFSDDGKNFAKYEMSDYVHNLHLLLLNIIPVTFLEANIHATRTEYRSLAGEEAYKNYVTSSFHEKLVEICEQSKSEPDNNKLSGRYENVLRFEYRNLVNEIRRWRLYEKHIEDTRAYLIRCVRNSFFTLIIIPLLIVVFNWLYVEYILPLVHPGLGANYYISKGNDSIWIDGIFGLTIFSLAAISGAAGSFISALLRILGVRDNNRLAYEIVAFKYSEKAIKMAPVTGMAFAIVLSMFFAAGMIGGTLFPESTGGKPWNSILFNTAELAKWLIWCFVSGFSERLVPDMVDRLSDKAKKAEE